MLKKYVNKDIKNYSDAWYLEKNEAEVVMWLRSIIST